MKLNYSKIIGIFTAISLMMLVLYVGYIFDKKIAERSMTVSSLQDKTFPFNTISDLKGKSIDSSNFKHRKLIINLSVKCPHCLDVINALDKSNDDSLKAKTLLVFKASASEIDSFSKKHKLKSLHFFHIQQNFVTHLIKSVPTFLVLDEKNKINKVYIGIPNFENKDSLVVYIGSLLTKNYAIKLSTPVESCQNNKL